MFLYNVSGDNIEGKCIYHPRVVLHRPPPRVIILCRANQGFHPSTIDL